MTIKIAGNQYKQNSKYYEQQIRHLIVDGVERYRLVVGEGSTGTARLVYAKGKVHFNWNWPKLGDGKIHPPGFSSWKDSWKNKWPPMLSTVYAFYNDGFYDTGHEDWNKDIFYYYGNKLSEIVGVEEDFKPDWATKFKGWFTAPSKGTQIQNIRDIKEKTGLFNYKTKTDTIPEITLYAQWEVPKIKITVHNVKFYCKEKPKLSSKTSFVYKGKRTTKSKSFYVLPYTDIPSEVKKRVTNPKYVSWAKHRLDNSSQGEKLRKGPQKFIGWYVSDGDAEDYIFRDLSHNFYHYSYSIDPRKHYKKGWEAYPWHRYYEVYPCFEPLVIIPKTASPIKKGEFIGGRFYTFDLEPVIWDFPHDPDEYDDNVKFFDPTWPRPLEGVKPNPFPYNDRTIEHDYYYEYLKWEPTYTEGYFYNTTYSDTYSDGSYRQGYRYYYGSTIVYTLKKNKEYYDIIYE